MYVSLKKQRYKSSVMNKNLDSFYYHVDPKKDSEYNSEDDQKLKNLKTKKDNGNSTNSRKQRT